MQARGAALPELDRRRRNAIAAPVRRAWHSCIAIRRFQLAITLIEIAAAHGAAAFDVAQAIAGAWYGRALLFLWAFALFFHLCNGIRHLAWDAGLGFDLKHVYLSGWTVVILSLLLTLGSFTAGYWYMGAF